MSGTAVALFRRQAAALADRAAYRALRAGGAPADEVLTWGEWRRAADEVAAGLVAAGHGAGEVAAVLGGNRTMWPVAEMGILTAGMVSAGVYPTSAPSQVRQILADAGATVAFVDDAAQLAKVLAVAAGLPHLRTVVAPDAVAADHPLVTGWDRWRAAGRRALAGGAAAELDRRVAGVGEADTAVLIYTSGSTGEPKGACIPHRYLLASARSIRDTLGLGEGDTALSFLPFCHAAERVFGLYTRLLCGMEAGLVEDHLRLWDAIHHYAPTVVGGLPRTYEKVYESLQVERATASGPARERWEQTLELGRIRSQMIRTGAAVPAAHEARWREVGGPLLERARAHFGGRMRVVTSGGAALPLEVAEFLDALGVTVLGAYGLTEHLCVAFNRADRYIFDGVGPAMPGTEIRIAADGEILVRRGPLTFAGYLGRPEETRAAFSDDGAWLHTGDLGTVDSLGFLHVTGRKKELIALSTGKKVAPAPVEAGLLQDPWIAQAMLYGEGRKFVSALICLRRELVEAWAAEHGCAPDGDFAALLADERVQARVQAAIDRVNAHLSGPERIRRQVVLPHELTAENDELTPTLKLRRAVVSERYRELLDALYLGSP